MKKEKITPFPSNDGFIYEKEFFGSMSRTRQMFVGKAVNVTSASRAAEPGTEIQTRNNSSVPQPNNVNMLPQQIPSLVP